MPHSRITITYQDQPIRIYGLPDEPVFRYQDIVSILGINYVIPNYELLPELEAFTLELEKEKVSVVNTAGIYKMIFGASDEVAALEFETFFIREVEPALRKYGYPAENKSC
ncbi:MAG: hypothetical protein RIC57_03480 [Balneola sp.]